MSGILLKDSLASEISDLKMIIQNTPNDEVINRYSLKQRLVVIQAELDALSAKE